MTTVLTCEPQLETVELLDISTGFRAGGGGSTPRVRLDGVPVRVDVAVAPRPPSDIVDEWGVQTFPTSEPPANW